MKTGERLCIASEPQAPRFATLFTEESFMAWIEVISEEDAEGDLAEQYSELIEPWGGVDNILKIHSLNPESLRAHVLLYKTVMYGKSPIRRPQREMIAVVASVANHCHYWIEHHSAGLRRLVRNDALVEAIRTDYRQADLKPEHRAMLDYAYKLTVTPWEMVEDDVKKLRDHGFSDRAILDINQITGYYAYVNRLADGLGVPLEDFVDGGLGIG